MHVHPVHSLEGSLSTIHSSLKPLISWYSAYTVTGEQFEAHLSDFCEASQREDMIASVISMWPCTLRKNTPVQTNKRLLLTDYQSKSNRQQHRNDCLAQFGAKEQNKYDIKTIKAQGAFLRRLSFSVLMCCHEALFTWPMSLGSHVWPFKGITALI